MKLRWKIAGGCLVSVIGLLALAAMSFTSTVRSRVDWKMKSPHENQAILLGELRQVAPEVQLESDTCGLHTLRAIYRAYGVDPDQENLRTRLGLDVPSNPLDSETTGTLQLDMSRVLVQDGFTFEFLDFSAEGAHLRLSSHLMSNNMAAVLIRRRQNGNLHWVALRAESDSSATVLDSLSEQPYSEPLEDYVKNYMLSAILISPAENGQDLPSVELAQHRGAYDMLQTVWRYRQLSSSFER